MQWQRANLQFLRSLGADARSQSLLEGGGPVLTQSRGTARQRGAIITGMQETIRDFVDSVNGVSPEEFEAGCPSRVLLTRAVVCVSPASHAKLLQRTTLTGSHPHSR